MPLRSVSYHPLHGLSFQMSRMEFAYWRGVAYLTYSDWGILSP